MLLRLMVALPLAIKQANKYWHVRGPRFFCAAAPFLPSRAVDPHSAPGMPRKLFHVKVAGTVILTEPWRLKDLPEIDLGRKL